MISAPDSLALEAVDAARAALLEEVGADVVGEHLSASPEAEGAVTHHFACTQAGYPGWVWAVTVAHAPGQDSVTVDEIVLLPGEDAIIAPPVGPLARPDPAGRPVAGRPAAGRRGRPAAGPDVLRRRAARRRREARGRRARSRPRPGAVAGGSRPRGPAVVRRRAGTRRPARPVRPRPMRRVRLPGASGRPALDDVRGVRQRVRQRRRPRGRARTTAAVPTPRPSCARSSSRRRCPTTSSTRSAATTSRSSSCARRSAARRRRTSPRRSRRCARPRPASGRADAEAAVGRRPA